MHAVDVEILHLVPLVIGLEMDEDAIRAALRSAVVLREEGRGMKGTRGKGV